MTKYPKTVCVVFNEFAQAMDARNNKKDAAFLSKAQYGSCIQTLPPAPRQRGGEGVEHS